MQRSRCSPHFRRLPAMSRDLTPSLRIARTLACLALGSLLAAGAVRATHAAPAADGADGAPSVAPKVKPATKDDLDFRPGNLSLVTDPQGGARYWIFTYEVANKTGKAQRFSPRFELLMGDGTILLGGSDVAPEVGRRLQRAAAAPDAADQFQIMGDILEGEENARDGYVVWPAKGDAKDVTLFVTGVSAAFDRVKDPSTGKETFLRRTWARDYTLPGSSDPRESAQATVVRREGQDHRWLMR